MQFQNPTNGYTKTVMMPFLWTLLFGFLYFMAAGVWSHALIYLVLALALATTAGPAVILLWLIYPFFAGGILRNHYLKQGWQEVSNGQSETAPRSIEDRPLPVSRPSDQPKNGQASQLRRSLPMIIFFFLFLAALWWLGSV